MIIDAHTHIFPDVVRESRSKYEARDPWFQALYGLTYATLASADDLVASMDAAEMDKSVALGFAWRDQGLCAESNDYVLQSMARHPGRISGFAAVQPMAGETAAREVERCLSAGMCGVGELNADGQDFALDDPLALGPVAEVLIAHGRPLLIHTSEPVGHLYPGKGATTPAVVCRFLRHFPDLKVICGHWGGGLPFYTLMREVAEATRNVYYDTSASTFLYRFDIFPVVIRLVGAERILMGSDYPLLSQAKFLSRIAGLCLPVDQSDLILGGNAARLLGL